MILQHLSLEKIRARRLDPAGQRDQGSRLVDEQRFGPYEFWHHRHTLEEVEGGVMKGDLIHDALPFGPFGAIAHGLSVRRQLEGIFAFRRAELERRFARRS